MVSCVLTDEDLKTNLAVRGRRITKYFGDVVALDGVDLDVATGQVHGLVGPNGAGKTTLLGILLGLALADEGTLEVLGQAAGRALRVPDGVAGFIDSPGVYPSLTARRNLAELARLRGYGAKADIDDALAQVGLADVADDKVRGFSLGMRQRIGLAVALLIRPRLLVLDEPSNGLDPAGRKHVHEVLRRLAADGTAVLLSSHQMDDLEALCSEVTIVAAGRVVFSGPLSKLADESRRGRLPASHQRSADRPSHWRQNAWRDRAPRPHGQSGPGHARDPRQRPRDRRADPEAARRGRRGPRADPGHLAVGVRFPRPHRTAVRGATGGVARVPS